MGLSVTLWIEHRRFLAASLELRQLSQQQAETRMAALRAKELEGKIILPASPRLQLKTLERRGRE